MLKATNIVFSYTQESNHVLDDVSLSLRHGEVVALVGANGSGKSTLARIVAGSMTPRYGEVTIDGERLERSWPQVGYVRQDPQSQLISEVVSEEVALGLLEHGLSRDCVERRVSETLEECGISHLAHMQTSSLSGGELQRLALAGVIAYKPSYLVLDEPTSMLDHNARELFNSVVRREVGNGVGVLLVTHRISEAMRADRVVVMDSGKRAWEGTPEELRQRPDLLALAHLETPEASGGRPAKEVVDGADATSVEPHEQAGGLLIERASVERDGLFALNDVSLSCARGHVLLLSGRTGSGKSTAALVASGVLKPNVGAAFLGQEPVCVGDVGLCQQHVEEQLFSSTVLQDVMFGPLNLGLDEEAARQLACSALETMGVSGELWGRHPYALSGGERRRVAIAGVVAMERDAYWFDEPTTGLDGAGSEQMRKLARRLANDGKAVVVISHDVDEWLPAVDDVVLLSEGKVSYAGSARHLFEDDSALVEAGLRSPRTRGHEWGGPKADEAVKPAPSSAFDMRVSRVTALHRVPAGIKVVGLLAVTILLFGTGNVAVVAAATACSVLLMAFAHIQPGDALRAVKRTSVVLVFALVGSTLVLDGTGDVPLAGAAGISSVGFDRGVLSCLRIVTLVWFVLAAARTTTSSEVARAILTPLRPLERLGVPLKGFFTTVTLTLRCIPMAQEVFRRIEVAQLVRRAPLHEGHVRSRLSSWVSVLIPAIATLMMRADELGAAMDERGFGVDQRLEVR